MKKHMKGTVAFILAAAMVFSLAACGRAGAEPEESIPAMAEQEESSQAEESLPPSEAEILEPSVEPEEALEPEDPYGLGIPVSEINWDAAVYDFSGDRMEDGWPSIYQNLAQTVNLVYNVWAEYGWHKDTSGQDASFLDVIAEAERVNEEMWENYDTLFYPEMYDILAPKADAPFQIDSETKSILTLMDGLSMEQLAQIMEEPLFQAFNGDDYMLIHNNDLVEYNNEQMAAANNILADISDEDIANADKQTAEDAAAKAKADKEAAEAAAAQAEADRQAAEAAAAQEAANQQQSQQNQNQSQNNNQGNSQSQGNNGNGSQTQPPAQGNGTADVKDTTPVVPENTPAPHEHSWTPVYEDKTVTVVVQAEWYEDQYEDWEFTENHIVCNQCGQDFGTDAVSGNGAAYDHITYTDCSSYGNKAVTVTEHVKVGTIRHPAVTETRTEQTLVGYICSCGATK